MNGLSSHLVLSDDAQKPVYDFGSTESHDKQKVVKNEFLPPLYCGLIWVKMASTVYFWAEVFEAVIVWTYLAWAKRTRLLHQTSAMIVHTVPGDLCGYRFPVAFAITRLWIGTRPPARMVGSGITIRLIGNTSRGPTWNLWDRARRVRHVFGMLRYRQYVVAVWER